MRTTSPLVALGLLTTLACASDPNKKVQSAQTELTNREVDAQLAPARVDAQQSQEDNADKLDQQQERTNEIAKADSKLVDAQTNLATAQDKLRHDRDAYDIKARARFDKLDAKAEDARDARNKSAKLTGKKRADFDAALQQYMTVRAETQQDVQNIDAVGNDRWAAERDRLDTQLDTFEKSVDRLRHAL